MSTTITIQLPEDIATVLREKCSDDLSQLALEALAAHGYRTRPLPGSQVQQMLGLRLEWKLMRS
jgi:hypothetical protein